MLSGFVYYLKCILREHIQHFHVYITCLSTPFALLSAILVIYYNGKYFKQIKLQQIFICLY